MYKAKDYQEKVLHRLKIAKGHLEKIIEMVKSQTYCIDILHQSNAVCKAIKETDNLILEHHLETCAKNAIKSGKGKEAINEIMNVFKKKNN